MTTDDTTPDSSTPDETAYADAVAELEQILTALEDDNIDVDALASKVERASQLITLCRDRIGAAKVQVEQVVADLDHQPEDQADGQPEAE